MVAQLRSMFALPIQRKSREGGFTLIEILIVVALLVGLMALLVQNFSSSTETAKEDQARIGMSQIYQSLQLYKVHNGRFPTTEQGLSALVTRPAEGVTRWSGPYIDENKLVDPWQQPFEYESDGRTIQIMSTGRDESPETNLYYPERTDSGEES